MKNLKTSLVLLSILALAVAAAASGALTQQLEAKRSAARRPRLDGRHAHVARRTSSAPPRRRPCSCASRSTSSSASTPSSPSRRPSAGYVGGADFNAVAKQLDANSVALSKAIASVYGAAAGKQFLERQEPLAGAHQVLRRLHGRDREEGHGRPEEGRREPDDVHPDTGRVLRQGDGAAEAGARERPDRARPAAQGSARRVRQGQLRAGVHAHGRCLQAHVHDRRPARRPRSRSRRASARPRARPRISRSRSTSCSASTRCSRRGRRRPGSPAARTSPRSRSSSTRTPSRSRTRSARSTARPQRSSS